MVGMDDSESFDMDEMIVAGKWRTAAGRELVSSGAGRKRRPCSTLSIHYSPFTTIDHFENLLRSLFPDPSLKPNHSYGPHLRNDHHPLPRHLPPNNRLLPPDLPLHNRRPEPRLHPRRSHGHGTCRSHSIPHPFRPFHSLSSSFKLPSPLS